MSLAHLQPVYSNLFSLYIRHIGFLKYVAGGDYSVEGLVFAKSFLRYGNLGPSGAIRLFGTPTLGLDVVKY